jgi:hypothetical protein
MVFAIFLQVASRTQGSVQIALLRSSIQSLPLQATDSVMAETSTYTSPRRSRIRKAEENDEARNIKNPMTHEGTSRLPEFQSLLLYRLSAPELQWASLQPYLEGHGYLLRPRYNPGFAPDSVHWWILVTIAFM